MKTREYSIRARGINDLNDRPDIWEQLRSLTVAIEKKMLAKRRSPYMGCLATTEALQKFDTDGSPIKLGDTKMTARAKNNLTYSNPLR